MLSESTVTPGGGSLIIAMSSFCSRRYGRNRIGNSEIDGQVRNVLQISVDYRLALRLLQWMTEKSFVTINKFIIVG